QLCQFLEGMPLALELAASWLKSLPCSAIIKEIERSPDFLNTPLRNLPTRHRSMRAVFEQSWKLLEDENRQVFKALSVFRGGFLRDAAEYVAGATLHMLTALVDKSLIRRESTGRYQIHELLRQYAAEQLSADSVENQHIHERHISYYMNLLRQHEPDLNSSRQQETIRELEAELDNIRAAWRHAVDNANVRALQKGAHAYYVLSDMRGRYLECIDAVEKAIKRLESLPADEERDYTLAILNSGLLGLCIRLGRFERAQAACETSIRLYDKLERPVSTGFGTDPLASGALLAVTLGDYEGALQLCERAARQIAPDDQLNLMFLYYVQANAAYSLGELESAFQVAQRGYQISSDLGDNFFGAYLLIVMGNIAQALEDYNRAWEYYRISYRLKKEFNERGGMAAALNFMARIAWLRGSLQEAEALFQRGCNLYREVNDPGGMATSLMGLGDTAQAQGDYLTARRYFCDALKIASDIHWTPLILALFVAISDLLIQTDATSQALDLLSLVSAHPATERLTKIRMQKLLTASGLKLPALPVDTTPANLEAAVVRVREQLELTDDEHVPLAAPPDNPPAPKGTDALSERELEILRLLAEGLTNQQIADQLILVIGTVKAHNHHIFAKLGVSNRVMAIARARELGLI
ncbi:MAG: tetratricopeptide repeat protein, partial [Anaerolineae bacterium]|nr:tetratricopeptide repeat protein [Anaerolineae bacterium]